MDFGGSWCFSVDHQFLYNVSLELSWSLSHVGQSDWFWNKLSCCRQQNGSEGNFRAASAAEASHEELGVRDRANPGLHHPVGRCPPGTEWRWAGDGILSPPFFSFFLPSVCLYPRILAVKPHRSVSSRDRHRELCPFEQFFNYRISQSL